MLVLASSTGAQSSTATFLYYHPARSAASERLPFTILTRPGLIPRTSRSHRRYQWQGLSTSLCRYPERSNIARLRLSKDEAVRGHRRVPIKFAFDRAADRSDILFNTMLVAPVAEVDAKKRLYDGRHTEDTAPMSPLTGLVGCDANRPGEIRPSVLYLIRIILSTLSNEPAVNL